MSGVCAPILQCLHVRMCACACAHERFETYCTSALGLPYQGSACAPGPRGPPQATDKGYVHAWLCIQAQAT